MTTAIAKETAYTDLDWYRLPDDGKRYEMVDGEPVELPPMRMSLSIVTGEFYRLFTQHISDEGMPFWVGIDASFRLGLPGVNFRNPDVSVTAIRPGAVSIVDEPRALDGSPDIAVEIISPTDAYVDVVAKAQLYLRQGVATVLLVDAYHREVAVRQATGEVRVLASDDVLTGEPVLPRFACPVATIFSGLDRAMTLEREDA